MNSLQRGTGVVCTGLILGVFSMPDAVAEELEEGSCPVVAAAQGVQVMGSGSDNLLLAAPMGAAAPVAQSCVDYGVGDSSGFASSPYPGELVVTSPGLLRGVTELPVPDYPLYVSSRYPSRVESATVNEGYALSSRSDQTSSEAEASAGVRGDAGSAASTMASAKSVVDPEARTAQAVASSDMQPVTLNGVLEIGRIQSSAMARQESDGKVMRRSQLSVGRTTVAGQEVEITRDGVRAAGRTVGRPASDPTEALKAAGVTVRYLEAVESGRGVLSAGIEVRAKQQDPESGATYQVHYTFGRSLAAVAPVDEAAGPVDEVAAPFEEGPGGGEGTSEFDAPSADTAPTGGGLAENGTALALEAPVGAEPPAVESLEPQVAVEQLRAARRPVDMGVTSVYVLIVFAALAMFVGGSLLRLLGVKNQWTS